MNWKISFISFFAIIAATCTIPFIHIDDTEITPAHTNVVEQVVNVSTNSISPSTNSIDRTGKNTVDWFKDSSNYIWDGWNIK